MWKIFQPIKIGDVEVKNRLVMLPLGLGLCEDGEVTDRLVDFYVERARGDVGLIDVVCCYNDFGYSHPGFVALDDDRFLPGIRRLTDALHGYGAKVFAQLMHQGASAPSAMLGHQAVSASAVTSQLTKEVPRELSIPEIKQTIEHLAEGAWRAKEGGFDGVEVIATGGYLVNQFLSPLTNQRTDEYGGDLESRMRFPSELIQRIREMVGPGYPISFRVCGDEFMRGGNTREDTKVVAKAMEKAGVDVFSVSAGWHQSFIPLITMGVPRANYVYLAQGIKEVVSVPVIAANRITDPLLAEQILLDHRADMVGMARALIVDPYLLKKAAEGRFREIRPCISCNQGCLDAVFSRREISCLMNSAAGRERELELAPAAKSRKVVVIGGGPAGMEAARVMALRGHRVTLYEKSERLGGQLITAAIAPERGEIARAVEYFANEMARLGVKVELGKEATPELVAAQKPDAVVVAAGATPIRPDIPGIQGNNVVYAQDVLEGRAEVGERVVVIGGGAIGAETALFIAKKGTIDAETAVFLASRGGLDPETAIQLTLRGNKKVTLLEMLDKVARDLGISTRWTILQSLRLHGVDMITRAKAERITDAGVIYRQDGEEKLVEADTVVIAVGTQQERALYEALKDRFAEVYCVGDCVEPRTALEAIHEGTRIGRQI